MEASAREVYGNGDYFTEKIMETEISNEIAFSGAEPLKDCSETVNNTESQVSEYPAESTDSSAVVFVEGNDTIHSFSDSVDSEQVHGNSEEKLVKESAGTLETVIQSEQNDINPYQEEQTTDSVDFNSAYIVEQGDTAYTPAENTNIDSIEEKLENNPTEEPLDDSVSTEQPEAHKNISEFTEHDVVEESQNEIISTEQYTETTDNGFMLRLQYEIDSGTVQRDTESSAEVSDLNIQENTDPLQIPEIATDQNQSVEEIPSLHLSDASGENLVIEEEIQTPNESLEVIEDEKIKHETAVEVTISNAKEECEVQVVEDAVSVQEPTQTYYNQTFSVTNIENNFSVIESPNSLEFSVHNVNENTGSESIVELQSFSENCEQFDNGQSSVDDSNTESASQNIENETSADSASVKKVKKTRKPTFDVPMHVMGHNIANPLENVPNGKTVPKPRLGVKVPYRNLTSQMVSKAEIEQEIMERSRMTQATNKGSVLFARSLTQRLARRIAPSEEDKSVDMICQTSGISGSIKKEDVQVPKADLPMVPKAESGVIQNDSDLLAILEGEDDDLSIIPQDTPQVEAGETSLKSLEREIALQQLQELPHQAPKPRVYKGRLAKESGNLADNPTKVKTTLAVDIVRQNILEVKEKNEPEKENTRVISPPKRDFHTAEQSPKKVPIEIEPQVKVNMVLKTYSRKRNISDVQSSPADASSPKKQALSEETKPTIPDTPTEVYMTKSSRIIKKKVIWDPDETPSRSPRPVMKPADISVKPVKTSTKITNSDKVEKKVDTDKVVKSVEKKVAEKVLPPEKVIKKKINPKVSNKTPVKYKKGLTEVERLLMDEGAVKMLYELKNTDDVPKKKKDFFSVERAHKEIIKKANQIKSELEQNTNTESPKSLRKKEGPSPPKPSMTQERKMSKDSIRSSVHTPPSSPFPHSQGSMLIRRRSSSSISSSDELESDAVKPSRKKSDAPKSKRIKKEETKVDLTVKTEFTEKSVPKSQYKSFAVKKCNKQVAIELNDENNRFFTLQGVEELTVALDKFSKDDDVNVVSVTSSSKHFCLGLDYLSLVCNKEEERKEKARNLAKKVKEFLLCLLRFPKVLVAGIQGECVGLGVTMLPLFDLVIASDTALFSTPYASLGSLGEAGFLLNAPYLTTHGLATELLYTGQKLTADEAFRRGLVSKLCWPEKYKDTLKSVMASIAKGSKQSLLATKAQLRSSTSKQIETALNAEMNILIEHWTSAECQKNFADISYKN